VLPVGPAPTTSTSTFWSMTSFASRRDSWAFWACGLLSGPSAGFDRPPSSRRNAPRRWPGSGSRFA